jgi:hypothetical protein
MRRRSAASASRPRVAAFSFTNSCWRAVSHSSGDTTGGAFNGRSVILYPLQELGTVMKTILLAQKIRTVRQLKGLPVGERPTGDDWDDP